MEEQILTFFELLSREKIQIPIIQRDYAQGRKNNLDICENFLNTIKESIESENKINLDFVYGNENEDVFNPLDGQQRLTTLFLLHWYAFAKETNYDEDIKKVLLGFTYETRMSSKRFCKALVSNKIDFDAEKKISEIISNSEWFFLSWNQDPTISAMLNTIDLIHKIFCNMKNIWDSLVNKKMVTFYLLILQDFGLTDDLYIKMNARGRLLTPFENLKAEIQDESNNNNWEIGTNQTDKFSHKIDTVWTDFLWKKYKTENKIDNAHMNFISTLIMINVSQNQSMKASDRQEIIKKINDNNSDRMLIKYIDKDTFFYICKCYDLYSSLDFDLILNLDMWRHAPKENLLNQILSGNNTSYTHKVLFYAQTEYLLRNNNFDQEKFNDWMRVIRNIVSRGDITKEGKRPDIIRSPEAFSGVIGLISELADGCNDIYKYLHNNVINSSFAKNQTDEEILKANIIFKHPEHTSLIHNTEDNELLRGRISFPLSCAGYKRDIDEIDFEKLNNICKVFQSYFNKDLDNEKSEFDMFRRAMLTIKHNGVYKCYEYWWSFWYAVGINKRKIFPIFRELEYFISQEEFSPYFEKLVTLLFDKTYKDIIEEFEKPLNMDNWQYRLIKEKDLLQNCSSKYIAIADDNSYCYLLKGKRPSSPDGCVKVE